MESCQPIRRLKDKEKKKEEEENGIIPSQLKWTVHLLMLDRN
jgi:hypothetical protein